MMAALPYSPTPLRSATSIRVISCVENGVNNTLHFKTTQIDLDDPDRPPYRCLSYTWGNPLPASRVSGPEASVQWDEEHQVLISESDTTEDVRLFTVTTNLLHFLQQFCTVALSDTPWIWIDAMSVNQLDLQERAAQVNMMGRIYTSCAEVIIWLGIGTLETQRVFEIMPILVKIPQLVWDGLFSRSSMTTYSSSNGKYSDFMKRLVQQGLPVPGQFVCEAFVHLLLRSWFHRIWTVQECLLPPRGQIWCGGDHMEDLISLPRLGTLADFYTLTEAPRAIYNEFSNREESDLVAVTRFLRDVFKEFKLVDAAGNTHTTLCLPAVCIMRFGNRLCLDPRDHIYGTLGLQDVPLFRADYNISVQELFTRVALHPAMSHFLLGNAEDESVRTRPDLPSWVYDWSSPMIPMPFMFCAGHNVYSAGIRNKERIVCERTSSGILATEGFEEDELAFIGGQYGQTIDGDSPGFINAEGLLRSLMILKFVKPNSEEQLRNKYGLVERFWRTLIADSVDKDSQHPSSKLYGMAFRSYVHGILSAHLRRFNSNDEAWERARAVVDYLHLLDPVAHLPLWKEIVDGIEDSGLGDEALESGVNYGASLCTVFNYRRFFITTKGRMGIATEGAKSKDVVVIVKGSEYPLLMRRGSAGRFRFLGQAYVDGIMYGEALQENSFRKIEIE